MLTAASVCALKHPCTGEQGLNSATYQRTLLGSKSSDRDELPDSQAKSTRENEKCMGCENQHP